MNGRWHELPWVAPRVPCLSTAAGTLAYVFEEMAGVGSNRHFGKLITKMAEYVKELLRLRALDGASSGWRFFTKKSTIGRKSQTSSWWEFTAGFTIAILQAAVSQRVCLANSQSSSSFAPSGFVCQDTS